MSNSNRVGEIIPDILNKYSAEVQQTVAATLKKDAQEARNELKSVSPRRTGKYAGGWSLKEESARFTTAYVLYNKTPGLPHLLEFGHETRNGTGRTFKDTPAHPHIAEIDKDLMRKVREDIEKAIKETGA